MVKMLPVLILIYDPSQKWEVGWRKQSLVIWSKEPKTRLMRCSYLLLWVKNSTILWNAMQSLLTRRGRCMYHSLILLNNRYVEVFVEHVSI